MDGNERLVVEDSNGTIHCLQVLRNTCSIFGMIDDFPYNQN